MTMTRFPSPEPEDWTWSNQELHELFDRGNYFDPALYSKESSWQHAAAIGMMGKLTQAISLLQEYSNPEAMLYLSVCFWMDQQDDKAISSLKLLINSNDFSLLDEALQHQAENFLNLMAKPTINILSMSPPNYPYTFLNGIKADRKFFVQNISFSTLDMPVHLDNSIHDYYNSDHKPDFMFVGKIEEPHFPLDLAEAPFPLIGHIADHELYTQSSMNWLECFDCVIAGGGSEYDSLAGLVASRLVTYTKLTALPNDMPTFEKMGNGQDHSILITGNTVKPFYIDKSEIVGRLMESSSLPVYILNGKVHDFDYWRSYAKMAYSFNQTRLPRGLQTRAVESIAMGCPALVQEGAAIEFYTNNGKGFVKYLDFNLDTIDSAVSELEENLEEHRLAAMESAAILRAEFNEEKVASEYFRFCAFQACHPSWGKKRKAPPLTGNRAKFFKTGFFSGSESMKSIILHRHSERWSESLEVLNNPKYLNDTSFESALLLMNHVAGQSIFSDFDRIISNSSRVSDIITLLENAMELSPESLALFFNWFRLSVHFGSENHKKEAYQRAQERVELDLNSWKFDLDDNIWTHDVANSFFDYRQAFSSILQARRAANVELRNIELQTTKKLIIASVLFYLGRNSDQQSHYQAALTYNKEFPLYKLYEAECCIRNSTSEHARLSALQTLGKLAELPITSAPAALLLQRHKDTAIAFDYPITKFLDTAFKISKRIIYLDGPKNAHSLIDSKLQITHETNCKLGEWHFNNSKMNDNSKSEKTLTIFLSGQLGVDGLHMLENLRDQTKNRNDCEIVWIDYSPHIPDIYKTLADIAVYIPSVYYSYHKGFSWSQAARFATGKNYLFLDGVVDLDRTFVEGCLEQVSNSSESILIRPSLSSDTASQILPASSQKLDNMRRQGDGAFLCPADHFDVVEGFEITNAFANEISGVEELANRFMNIAQSIATSINLDQKLVIRAQNSNYKLITNEHSKPQGFLYHLWHRLYNLQAKHPFITRLSRLELSYSSVTSILDIARNTPKQTAYAMHGQSIQLKKSYVVNDNSGGEAEMVANYWQYCAGGDVVILDVSDIASIKDEIESTLSFSFYFIFIPSRLKDMESVIALNRYPNIQILVQLPEAPEYVSILDADIEELAMASGIR